MPEMHRMVYVSLVLRTLGSEMQDKIQNAWNLRAMWDTVCAINLRKESSELW
jgi:hypothetical protein